jgi:4-oxalomesaconate tautomerase
MQIAIPYMQLRGGSSKGLFFNAADLPGRGTTLNVPERDRLILGAMEGVGPGDPRQIDGLGGATPLTSKVAVVSRSDVPGVDLDYLFLQVVVGEGRVSAGQNCGNILAGVLPFAIEAGLLPATDPVTSARINMVNTGGMCEVTVQTPGGVVNYNDGPARVDGVPGTAAPIVCHYLDTAGATCGALLPTGRVRDTVGGVAVTCIDNGMPVVLLRAADFGLTGYELPAELESNESLKASLERIRLAVGPLMHLGDVTQQTIPKMCLIAPPRQAIGVLGAVSVATACALPGSVAEGVAVLPAGAAQGYSIEHPSGEFTVQLALTGQNGAVQVRRSGVVRTARLLSRGVVYVPV